MSKADETKLEEAIRILESDAKWNGNEHLFNIVLQALDNSISKEVIENIIAKYKPNSTETFITNQENYIKLYKELQELLEGK